MSESTDFYINKAFSLLEDSRILLDASRFESSVSRSYYAMFHATKAILETISISSHTHVGVNVAFNKHFVKTGLMDLKYAKILKKGEIQRMIGDYEIGRGVNQKDATEMFSMAEEYLNVIKNYIEKNSI
ncbi:MAG: HEPN domain-containing protein [Spirosomataceae bacterium]